MLLALICYRLFDDFLKFAVAGAYVARKLQKRQDIEVDLVHDTKMHRYLITP